MPTPFTHLELAQRLLQDTAIPAATRALLNAQRPAFLLGSIAADARVGAGISREMTHFYAYDQPIAEHPWRVMLIHYPTLQKSQDAAQRAFLAGYVAHLALDEAWGLQFVRPQFMQKQWNQPRAVLFLALHLILIYMDARDLAQLEGWQYQALPKAHPTNWLPFMPDSTISDWRDYITQQIVPGADCLTIDIFSERILIPRAELHAIADSPTEMQARLWDFVPKSVLNTVEPDLYRFTREQLCDYWETFV